MAGNYEYRRECCPWQRGLVIIVLWSDNLSSPYVKEMQYQIDCLNSRSMSQYFDLLNDVLEEYSLNQSLRGYTMWTRRACPWIAAIKYNCFWFLKQTLEKCLSWVYLHKHTQEEWSPSIISLLSAQLVIMIFAQDRTTWNCWNRIIHQMFQLILSLWYWAIGWSAFIWGCLRSRTRHSENSDNCTWNLYSGNRSSILMISNQRNLYSQGKIWYYIYRWASHTRNGLNIGTW